MYSGPLCNFCDAAKRLLLRNNLEFREIDVSTKDELRDEMIRIKKIMHFPSIKIAKFLGINIEQPFLDENVIDYTEKIPVSLKVNEKNGKKYGKWILRKAYPVLKRVMPPADPMLILFFSVLFNG